jgi:hypothetical protein
MDLDLPLLKRAVAILAGAFVLLVALLFAFQRKLLYHPRPIDKAAFPALVAQQFGRAAWVLAPFDAIVVEPEHAELGPARGTVLLFHGNAELALDRTDLAQAFSHRGFRAVLAEYPGYGTRAGGISQQAIVEDALALYRAVRARFAQEPVVLAGASLGSGVAVQVAARVDGKEAPSRLVLLTPYLSISNTAALAFPFLPARYLVLDRFDSERDLRRYAGPVAVGIAADDEVVGAAQGHALAQVARARGPTSVVTFENAIHNDWSMRATDAQWAELLGR